jgi:serine phosphatase RsbU (regulator of sigma subunit)
MQRDQLSSQLDIQKQQTDEYYKQQELGLQQQEIQVKQSAVQVDMLKVQAMSASDANKQAIQQETNRMAQILEIQKLELDQMRMRLSESEKLMEERRLASEQQIERVRLQMDVIQKKRKATIINDTQGNPIGIDIQDIIE